MKIVVSNSQVAHLWANQSQEHARSGSMHFRGRNIFSYSTCIGGIHSRSDGQGHLVLLNSRHYSNTTSGKHMPAIRNALAGLWDTRWVILVPEVANRIDLFNGIASDALDARDHAINQQWLLSEYREFAATLMRAQSLGEWRRQGLLDKFEAIRAYASAFGFVVPDVSPSADWIAATARRERLDSSPEAIARKARAERIAAERERVAALGREQREAEWLAAFRNGNGQGYYNIADSDGAAYLRVRGDVVQTSRGASVPVSDAIRAIRFIQAIMARGSDWTRNGELCPVGAFQIDRIEPNGNIRAGCHFIKWEEIQSLIPALGLRS